MNDLPDTISDAFVLKPENSDDPLVLGGVSVSGHVPSCFLSMFDALLFGVHQSRQTGEAYEVLRASEYPHFFADHDDHQKPVALHVAWPARDGRLLIRDDGRFHNLQWVQKPKSPFVPQLHLDEEALEFVDSLHELAGLFAWQETHRDVLTWDRPRLTYAIERALRVTPTEYLLPSGEITQYALYDPEFGQWHFVPRALPDMPIPGV
ncbi:MULTISPECIES: hypothetical protein [Paraburkholderia]|uniref:hypothetical protein n=1 Tax=Paraburkholderia TaxID=1822464 RepID=UPI00225939E9|nr:MULTISPECIES: hypothetical protein [Paraburkholderia]MCX4160302.1 hypothetical protein [Paraburkholderia megapolitana]MDN7155801.1 hypothetical protein [Paraburkholderia sp. CHISQ3]MDQ6492845.1 hypothetical protein [Paraburkholderia megapolitana]